MKTDAKDYLLSALLIGIAAAISVALALAAHPLLARLPAMVAPLALLLVLLGGYGLGTAALLGLLARRLPLVAGDYRMDDAQFTLWKVQHVAGELGKAALTVFFPVFSRPALYWLFGARTGRATAVAGKLLDPRLTVLGDGCVLGEGCIVTAHTMSGDRFLLREVHVGAGATVGVGCIVMPGVRIGAGAVVLPGSVLKAGTVVPPGETWGGAPARPVSSAVS